MDLIFTVAQRALSPTERFVTMPLFALVFGGGLVAMGIVAIRSKRIAARRSERLLLNRSEWTGRMAIFKGATLCFFGAALIIVVLVMMILGRTLLG